MPQRAFFFFAFHLQVRHRALQHRVPVDQAFAAVNQPLLVELDKGLSDCFGQIGVHGEVLTAPVHTVAHAAHLAGDGAARLFFPLPHFVDKVFARLGGRGAHVVAADALCLKLALHHDLGGNACVVGARNPGGVEAHHAVVAREAVHDGLVEGVAHVQGAGHVGWRQLDGKGRRTVLWCLGATEAGHAVATLFPFWTPMGFQRSGLERFGQAVEAWLCGFGGRQVAHGHGFEK